MDILVCAAHSGRSIISTSKLLPSIAAMGSNVRYIGWDRLGQYPRSYSSERIVYKMIFRGWGYSNPLLFIALPLWMMRLCIYLLRQFPDIAIANDFDTGLPMAIASLVTRIPFIYNIRDNFAMRGPVPKIFRPLINSLDKWVIRRAIRVIVPDEIRITEIDENYRKKYVVINNCAPDIDPPSEIVKSSPFTIYSMGYLRKSRGIGLLLDAAGYLEKVRILLAGNVDEDDLLTKIKSNPNVDYRGLISLEDSLRLCYEADVIFTYYSPDSEINRRAISNKWSDAMMASKPILVNAEVVKSSWIASNDIGYVCPYYDQMRLVSILKDIRAHPEEAMKKGKNGRRLYDSGFSWQVMEKRIWKLLEEVRSSREGKA